MRLIDADELVKKWEEMLPIMVPDEDGKHPVSLEKAIEKLKDAPTVDAVPVVRCKDCDKAKTNLFAEESHVVYCIYHGMSKQYDDFCSYGERKDGE